MTPQTIPSPNFGPRRDGARPDLLVLHYTATATADAACKTLCDPAAEVSAHYLIDPAGQITALVDEAMRAWHAGAGRWGDVTDVNSRSIGIEIANPGNCPFAAPQFDALEQLMTGIMDRWQIPPARVIGHSDMAPGRKIDPGPRFDWRRLARQGLAIWPVVDAAAAERVTIDPDRFRADLATFGYTAAVDDDTLLHSFRLRFHPGTTGPLTRAEMATAAALADQFPVDVDRAAT